MQSRRRGKDRHYQLQVKSCGRWWDSVQTDLIPPAQGIQPQLCRPTPRAPSLGAAAQMRPLPPRRHRVLRRRHQSPSLHRCPHLHRPSRHPRLPRRLSRPPCHPCHPRPPRHRCRHDRHPSLRSYTTINAWTPAAAPLLHKGMIIKPSAQAVTGLRSSQSSASSTVSLAWGLGVQGHLQLHQCRFASSNTAAAASSSPPKIHLGLMQASSQMAASAWITPTLC